MTENNLSQALAHGKTVFYSTMGRGTQSFLQQLTDFIKPAGNETGLDCLLTGHTWELGNPQKFQFNNTPVLITEPATNASDASTGSTVKALRQTLPETPTWACFCHDCGAGTYFTDLPNDVFTFNYWCRDCSSLITGDNIIDHAQTHLENTGR